MYIMKCNNSPLAIKILFVFRLIKKMMDKIFLG